METFDLDSAFDEFLTRFRGERSPAAVAKARLLWGTLVNANDGDDQAALCHQNVLDAITERARSWSPEFFLKKAFGAKVPSVEPPRPAAASAGAPPTEAPAVSESYTAFREVWGGWPHDPARRRESESAAKMVWDQTAAKHGAAAVRAACLDIARDEARLTHRRNLSTVLAALLSGEESIAARPEPTDADLAAFKAAYSRYPRPARDEQEAFDLWFAHVQPEERLLFQAAVVEYAADGRKTEKTKFLKWSNFVAGEWRERDAAGVLWAAIRTAAGIDDDETYYYGFRRDEDDHLISCRVDFVPPDGPVEHQVAGLIDFVNANRARGYVAEWADGPSHYPDPIALTSDEVIEGAYRVLVVPGEAERCRAESQAALEAQLAAERARLEAERLAAAERYRAEWEAAAPARAAKAERERLEADRLAAERKAAVDAARKPQPGCETCATFGVNFVAEGPRPCRIHGDTSPSDNWCGACRRTMTHEERHDIHLCRVGCTPVCTTCRRQKAPVRRPKSAGDLCGGDCAGYYSFPRPCDLQPGEARGSG